MGIDNSTSSRMNFSIRYIMIILYKEEFLWLIQKKQENS